MKLIHICGIIGLAAAMGGAHAQTTELTAAPIDTDGTAWVNGTCTILYLQVPNFPGSLVNSSNGQPIANPGACAIDSSGNLTAYVVQTKYVYGPNFAAGNSPGVSINVCPEMARSSVSTACYATGPIVVGAGPTQSVATQVNAAIVAPRIAGISPLAQAYNDTEVAATAGNSYVRLSDGTQRCYTSGAWGSCGAASGVTSVTATSPITSSGGTTPAIGCATCTTETGATTGYLAAWGTAPALVNSHIDDGVTAASTVTVSENLTDNGLFTVNNSTALSQSLVANNNATGSYINPFAAYCPNLAAGGECLNVLGGSGNSANNEVRMNFHMVGSGSSSNYVYWDFYGNTFLKSTASGILTTHSGNTLDDGSGNMITIGGFKVGAARKGTFVCTNAGTITISNTNELVTSDVIISMNTAGGTITTPPAMKTVTSGTGFTVLCGATDTSTYNYDILN